MNLEFNEENWKHLFGQYKAPDATHPTREALYRHFPDEGELLCHMMEKMHDICRIFHVISSPRSSIISSLIISLKYLSLKCLCPSCLSHIPWNM